MGIVTKIVLSALSVWVVVLFATHQWGLAILSLIILYLCINNDELYRENQRLKNGDVYND
jgi:hypothetical protein